jgi:hypothetical protein
VHVLDSSANRSVGDIPTFSKVDELQKTWKWKPIDSLLNCD